MKRALILLALATTGCAAVFKGGRQDVEFTGQPASADVRVNGTYAGALPTKAKVDREKVPNVVVSAPGHKDQYVRLEKKPDTAWWFWDIATCVVPVTLCIPVLVDAISGAWYDYEDTYAVKLDPLPVEKIVRPAREPETQAESPRSDK